ncbi:hypothetical protein A2482_03990 [Candidatus Falkowbacteria bacterium RIFOXYC2_FULL_48_21]|uniref:Uncharacterized protein n=1 Tax=Candidatus Falkowbacteria bacterium RIFOXYC2_FULL_48_21 TaxID=1798005 RepID=A0A1F5TI18_9BACT|nr:MAG: hypothetical protein A2482_03990 [Candidatus Falkowbacteria bacterium RIFOXYC2_FULL_48_21]
MNLENSNFSGARVQEVRGAERIHSWVLSGGKNPDGTIGMRLAPDGGGITECVFYPEFWETHVSVVIRTVIFTRVRLNGDSKDFPNQPDESVTGYWVKWEK